MALQFLRSADAFISSPTDNENCLLEHRDSRDQRDREDTVNITDNLLSEVAPRGIMDQDGLSSNVRTSGSSGSGGFKESRNSMGVTFKGEHFEHKRYTVAAHDNIIGMEKLIRETR